MQHHERVAYRPEIDGVRAIAVLAIIFFHAGYSPISGGFLGVDIFLVISGYLITKIIHTELERGSFSILSFYERRIRRIIPALLLVIALTAVPAYFLMLPDDLENYGQSVVATLLFANNILLMMTSDYFALATEFKPLMHTWSLAVEEQYYVVIPLTMMAMHRIRGRRTVISGIVLVTLVSLGYCFWAAREAPDANFYLIFSRAWELGAGALVALGEPAFRKRFDVVPSMSGAAALVGLAMVVIPMFVLHEAILLPDWPTLIPVTGVCLLLLFANGSNVAGRFLSWGPMVAIGLISYSAYLFHQPIFAFVRIASLDEPSIVLMTSMAFATFLCAYFSWRYVEQPFRSRTMPFTSVALACVGLGSVALAAGLAMVLSSGFYNDWPELAQGDTGFGMRQNKSFNQWVYRLDGRVLPAKGSRPNVLVIGNSFARDFVNMGYASGNFAGVNVSYSSANACGATPDSAWRNAPNADYIIFASGPTAETASCILDRVNEMQERITVPVIVIGTKNFGWNNNAVMLLDASVRYSYRTPPLETAREDNEVGRRTFSRHMFVDIMEMLDDEQGRVPVFTPTRKFISQDRQHLTMAGSEFVGALIFSHPSLRVIRERANRATAHLPNREAPAI